MSRYAIKFSKTGTIRYISHLDLLRLFKRAFKRTGIKLVYSQGFNPHPKMSFAQPLSLGYCSSGEYLEFDTTEPYPIELILDKLNSIMPEGIRVVSATELPSVGKSLAALTEAASYEVSIPLVKSLERDLQESISNYVTPDQILVMKHQKKSGKDIPVDIKPMILEMNGLVNDNVIMLTMRLDAGSTSNLSPEMVLSSFCDHSGIEYDRADVLIKRTDIYFTGLNI